VRLPFTETRSGIGEAIAFPVLTNLLVKPKKEGRSQREFIQIHSDDCRSRRLEFKPANSLAGVPIDEFGHSFEARTAGRFQRTPENRAQSVPSAKRPAKGTLRGKAADESVKPADAFSGLY